MIYRRLADKGKSTEQILDLTPQMTRLLLVEESNLIDRESGREAEIRANLQKYSHSRLLTMKYQQQLDEHLKKVGSKQQQELDALKAMIVERIRNA